MDALPLRKVDKSHQICEINPCFAQQLDFYFMRFLQKANLFDWSFF